MVILNIYGPYMTIHGPNMATYGPYMTIYGTHRTEIAGKFFGLKGALWQKNAIHGCVWLYMAMQGGRIPGMMEPKNGSKILYGKLWEPILRYWFPGICYLLAISGHVLAIPCHMFLILNIG